MNTTEVKGFNLTHAFLLAVVLHGAAVLLSPKLSAITLLDTAPSASQRPEPLQFTFIDTEPEPEAEAEAEAESASEPEPVEGDKPKRGGWWQKRSFL